MSCNINYNDIIFAGKALHAYLHLSKISPLQNRKVYIGYKIKMNKYINVKTDKPKMYVHFRFCVGRWANTSMLK